MNGEEIDEALDRLGYRGGCKEAVKGYLKEYLMRKNLLEQGPITMTDIVTVSFIFGCLNRNKKGK